MHLNFKLSFSTKRQHHNNDERIPICVSGISCGGEAQMGGCCSCFEPPDEWSILQQARGGEKGAGFLYKRAKSKAIWSNRFFVLTNTKLIYYGGEDRAEAKGEIVLAGAIAQNSTTRANSKKKFYFQISHPECGMREFYAVSNNRRNQWVNIINDMSNVLRPLSQYGKMYKQGGLAKSSWQERWCICVGNDLDYFENATENQPKGSISKSFHHISHIFDGKKMT